MRGLVEPRRTRRTGSLDVDDAADGVGQANGVEVEEQADPGVPQQPIVVNRALDLTPQGQALVGQLMGPHASTADCSRPGPSA